MLLFCVPGWAQTAPPSKPFISAIQVKGSANPQQGVDDTLVDLLKDALLRHGFQVDDCQLAMRGVQQVADNTSSLPEVDFAKIESFERIVAEASCRVPEGVPVYSAVLAFNVDGELKSRRAVLRVARLGTGVMYAGGYANKPGELVPIHDMIDRAVRRALRSVNEPTVLSLVMPPTAEVGRTVNLDARSSWDPDGDPFKLVWDIRVPGCRKPGADATPVDGWPCGNGSKREKVGVPHAVGNHDQTQTFTATMVGDYDIKLHASVGSHDEATRTYHVRVYPRRSRTFFARVEYLPLPTNFMRTIDEPEVALMDGIGYVGRLFHRLGFWGWYEDVSIGASLNSIQPLRAFDFDTSGIGTTLGVEIFARTMDRTGRFGVSTPLSLQGGYLFARRGDYDRGEGVLMAKTALGGYFAFSENYRFSRSKICLSVCPSLEVGPTLSVLYNMRLKKVGIPLGVQMVMGVEF